MAEHDKMTKKEVEKKEDIVKGMKKNFAQFRKEYGDKAKDGMYATATKRAMGEESEEVEEEEVFVEHMCAKHVYHDIFGEGTVLEGEHAVPNEEGKIEWYTVEFDHGKETVFTEDVEVMHERHHGHMMKKKKKMSEEEVEEELTGNQHKIDANKNGKIDAQDFKMLKKIKKARG